MEDTALRALIEREVATLRGRWIFEDVMQGLDAVAKAYAMPEARGEAEKVLKSWMAEDQHPLRKALSAVWLQRARGVGNAVEAGIRGYKKGADKAQGFGSKVGAFLAESTEEAARARYQGGSRAMEAVQNRIPWNSPSRGLQFQAAKEAGEEQATKALVAVGAARGGRIGRAAYHGVAAVSAGAAVRGVAGGLSDKEMEQRKNAARSRWANHNSAAESRRAEE